MTLGSMVNNGFNVQREQFWDIIKGIAILLMLIGHSIQCGQGLDYFQNQSCFDNPIFKLIYGFHMPLFMFVGGYFFYQTVQKRNFIQLLNKLFFSIIIPLIAFGSILFLSNNYDSLSRDGFALAVKSGVLSLPGSLWFLWAYLFCSILLGLCCYLKLEGWWPQLVAIVILYCIPDYLLFWNMSFFKFLYPFFLLGYYVRKFDVMNTFTEEYLRNIGIAATALYLILIFTAYTKDTYIYTSKAYIFQNGDALFHLYNDILRLVVGFLGVIGSVSLLNYIYRRYKNHFATSFSVLADMGCKSMGIYCFQDLIVRKIPQITPPPPLWPLLSIAITFCVLMIFSYTSTYICKHNKFLNYIFLGGR